MNSDIDIINNCLNGDQLAYKQLYNKYIAYCYGICTRYSISSSDLKDVVQIIFSQVFQSLKNYDSEKSKFKTWFTRVCINNLLSYKKKHANKFQTLHFEDYNESANPYTEDQINNNIDKAYILSVIKQMPENYQIVFRRNIQSIKHYYCFFTGFIKSCQGVGEKRAGKPFKFLRNERTQRV